MRILNIMLAQVRGGVETMSLRYHEAMKPAGIEVLSLGHPEGVLGQNLPPDDFRPVRALINHDPLAALTIRRIAREVRPDLILTHGNRATGICLLPCLGTARRTVQVVHNFRHKGQSGHLRAAICVSASVHDSVRRAHPNLPIYDLANFGPLSDRPVKPAPQGTVVLGTLGRLHVNKGIDIMIRALASLRARGLDVRLRIGGDGPLKDEMVALVRLLGLEHRVDFDGWVSRAADYLHALDLFVLPSRVEPFGLVVAESMAAGVPIVATDIDGPKEILLDGVLGVLSPKDDPDALAFAIATALSDWPATLKKARAAQTYALTHFSLDAGKRRLVETLNQIAAGL
ncbi:glycosyltransferase [Asticcacaulis sp. EMRT-3]|uniref:glycosyltransferase n=1 Tax=Asticcacaulis sp. EMRT-3 TaxID=3040349 RepID=UPI0024AF867F|nr:glycosyltransferase [Asticcacaulis sp. EMRT-3]MDI7775501.1 glycosyltransferase [Asticcacaulis sp. EMRT-3]